MKKVSFTAVVYERFRTPEGMYPVKLRVTYNRVPVLYATNMLLRPSELSLSSAKKTSNIPIKENTAKMKVLELIRTYEKAAESFPAELFPEYTTSQVMAYLQKVITREQGFKLKFVEFGKEIAEQKKKTSKKSGMNYEMALKSICSFLGKKEFDISLITSSLLRDYEQWLRDKYGDRARAVSLYMSSISSIHKAARNKYNSEEMDVLYIKNPFDYYHCPQQAASHHRDVSLEDIQKMIDDYPTLKGRQRLAVGAFLLSFTLMGMNSPDLYECLPPKDNILHYYRHKTRDRRDDRSEMYVKIPNCIIPIYKEYADNAGKRAFNFYQRYASYDNMRDAESRGLAAYRQTAGISSLTFYSARHTWATIARSSECNVPMAIIDDCLAHAGAFRQGDIYAKKDYSVLWAANETVLSTLNWVALTIR